jgi:hypothetical protein
MRGQLPTRAGARPYTTRPLSGITGGRIHYTAGPTWSSVESIAYFQTGPNAQEDFPAIAYHYLVDGNGIAYWCHNPEVRCWHSGAPGVNVTDVAVCYTGLIEPNDSQIVGIANATLHVERLLGHDLTWRGHKEGYATTCPGPKWNGWWPKVEALR